MTVNVAGKEIKLEQLAYEFAEAGIEINGLGTTGLHPETGRNMLHTYNEDGSVRQLPAGSAAVVKKHKPQP